MSSLQSSDVNRRISANDDGGNFPPPRELYTIEDRRGSTPSTQAAEIAGVHL